MKKTHTKKEAGFTLIELALIIAVLGILGAVGAVKLASMTQEANRAAESTALANARSALAIALVKDADGAVTKGELATYLDGFVEATSKVGNVQLQFDSITNITTISTASAFVN
jgi:type II secretory pathway pseudopilin PulG